MALSNFLYFVFAFFWGAIAGSFLNVCIIRFPKEESVISPRSHCRQCKIPLLWYDLIPLVSFLWLKGKCRFCKAPISIEYFIVELLTALVTIKVLQEFGVRSQGFCYLLFVYALIVATVIDLHHRIIPDIISIGGMVFGFLLSFHFLPISFVESLLGILTGGGFLFLLGYGYFKLTGREGMGGGDIKLAAMIGAFLGYKAVFLILFVSSILGSLAGIFMMLIQKQNLQYALPFGPFLALAAWLTLFHGDMILYWLGYFSI